MTPTSEQIIHHFSETLQPDAKRRQAAEHLLHQWLNDPHTCNAFTMQMMHFLHQSIMQQQQQLLAVQQACVIFLKNHVRRNWRRERGEDEDEDDGNSNNSAMLQISQEVKMVMKEKVIECIVHAHHIIRQQFKEILRFMIQRDYPMHWTQLHSQLAHFLHSNDPVKIGGVLVAVQVLVHCYRYGSGEHRSQRQVIAESLFPLTTQLFGYLCQDNQCTNYANMPMATMRRLCVKIFWSLVQDQMPNYFVQNPQEFGQWVSLFVTILDTPIPVELDSSNPFWKTKKWICHTAYKLVCNYIAPDFLQNSQQKEFARMFLQEHATKFLKSFMTMLQQGQQGQYIPTRQLCLALYYLNMCTANAKIYKETMQAQLKPMIEQIIFSYLCLTDEEQEQWETDPREYLFKSFDVVVDLSSTKIAAMNVISDILKRKRESMSIILGMISDHLNRYAQLHQKSKQAISLKEGSLYILGNIRRIIRKDTNLLNSMEELLVMHVFPELNSTSVPVLRAKACWIAGKYCKIPWKNVTNFDNALKATLQCMHDAEQPVRLIASIAINKMVDHPRAEAIIKPVLPELIQAYLKLMNEIDQEDIVESLGIVVESFAEEMVPYAIELCTTMSDHFIKLFNADRGNEHFDNGDDDGGNAGYVAQYSLEVLCTVLKSLSAHENRGAICQQLEHKLLAVVDMIFHKDGFEFIEKGMEILMHLTYMLPAISDACWTMYPRLLDSVQSYAYGYMSSALYALDNYISRGMDCLTNLNHMYPLLMAVRHYLASNDSFEPECQSASLVLSVLLQHCRGRIDAYVPSILELVVGRLRTAETSSLKTVLLNTVADSLIYNAVLSIQILEKREWTSFVFSTWFSHLDTLQRVFDKKMSVLGLSALLHMDQQQLPQSIHQNFSHIISSCVTLLHTIQQQTEKEEKVRAELERERKEMMERAERGELEELWDADDYLDDEEAEEFHEDEEGDVSAEAQGLLEVKRQKFIASVAQFDDDAFGIMNGDDDFVEEDVHETPINDMDERQLFAQSVHKLLNTYGEQTFSQSLIRGLDVSQKQALQQLMQHYQ